jgi:small-conductance mechanosensitive channel
MAVLRSLLILVLLLSARPGWSQTVAEPTATVALTRAEADLAAVDRALDGRVDADDRPALRARAVAAQAAARSAAGRLDEELARVDARRDGIGPVTPGVTEAIEIREQRTRLQRQHDTLDAAVKRARLAGVEAQQLIDEIDRVQAEQLNQTLATRTASPLAPGFWRALLVSIPRDLRRIELFLGQGMTQIARQWRGGLPWEVPAGAAVALILLIPAQRLGRRAGQRYLIGSAPGHKVRRSAYAIWRVIVGTVAPMLAAAALVQGFRWAGLLPERWSGLLDGFVAAAGAGGFTASLAGAVLMRSQPSWRIAPIADATAQALRPLSWLLAALAFATVLIDAFNRAVGASAAATATTQAVEALLHLALIASFLLVLGRLRVERMRAETAETGEARIAGIGFISLSAWLLVGVAVVALLLGYIGFSVFVARMIVWVVILVAGLYLMMHAADDVATSIFNRSSRVGASLTDGLGLRGSVVDQFGLLLSAVLRLALVLVALSLLLSPFGAGGVGSLFGRLGSVAQGVEIAGIAIAPGTILRSVAVLFIGLALVRAFMGWLEKRYLPATDLDGSGRNSVGLVARYLGVALTVIWSLASLGIGVERIALLLSALSVGIGFGLQAITSNFVSGLILLAERPIKIGDWVRVGTDEGDVKRISVRSTEIALADHSTLIVPNSELITKTVLNKTLASPLGRLQIQFSVPLGTDAALVRQIVLDTFATEPAILDTPAPAAFVDSIADGRILFNSFAHVASPRDAYGARSNVFLQLLTRFRTEAIDIGTVPQRLELARQAPPATDPAADPAAPPAP